MNKIKVLLEDKDYKNAFLNFLHYYPEIKSKVEMVNSSESLNNLENFIILSDSENVSTDARQNNTFYKLSSNSVSSKNEIYKYANIKDILKQFIKEDEFNTYSDYHVYTINSPSENSGKSFVSKSMAEIVSKTGKTALIKLIDEEEVDSDISLSELILMSIKDKDAHDYIRINDEGFYEISGFHLVRDYVEMDIKNLKILLNYLHKKMGFDFFIIELPSYLDKTSEEIIKISKMNFIICDRRKRRQSKKLDYLREIGEKAWDYMVIDNFCQNARETNELPRIRNMPKDEVGEDVQFLESDYLLFKHKVAQCLGVIYA